MKKNKNIIVYIIIITIITFVFAWKIYPVIKGIIGKNELKFILLSNNIEVKIGDTVPINYELDDNLSVFWKSDDDSVVSVNNGVITGIGLGSTIVHGTVTKDGEIVTRNCFVSTYDGLKDLSLSEIVTLDGELFITKGDNYKLEFKYNPVNSYITSIKYKSLDENIVSFSNGVVSANNIGVTNIVITANNSISKNIIVNVVDKKINPVFASKVKNIDIKESRLIIKPNESQKIEYSIIPEDGFIETIEWISSNSDIVAVNDGTIIGKSSGEAIIKLMVNNQITKEIKVIVSIPVTGISLKSSSKIVLKVGQQYQINTEITPVNATNKSIQYNSDSNNINIDKNGLITAVSKGSGNVIVKSIDGDYSLNIPYIINPINGIVNGNGGVWSYTSSRDKVLERAGIEFFRNLASNGKGTLSGSVYTYTDAVRSYRYDINNSILNTNGHNILMRVYYPAGVDLSQVNTFTFFGGGSERSFGGYFDHLDKNRSELKSSGIILLISARSSYGEKDGIYATDFIKSIVSQKDGVKNAVGGYSMSGEAAGDAANNGSYDRLIIFDSNFEVSKNTNLRNKEIVIYSPVNDAMLKHTLTTLNNMMNYIYSDVTIVSNNSQIINKYSSKFLVINPGNLMGEGHGYVNISNGNVFSYACR